MAKTGHIFKRADIGGHEIDEIVERPDPYTVLCEKAGECAGIYSRPCFHNPDISKDTDIGDIGKTLAAGKLLAQNVFNGQNLALPGPACQEIQGGIGHSAGQGIGHKGRPVHEDLSVGADAILHLVCTEGGGQCHGAACESFTKAEDVWRKIGPLQGKEFAGMAKAGCDFIKDEQRA